MNRCRFALLCALCLLLAGTTGAQTPEKAEAAYRTFLRLNNEGGDKTALYDALYRCYEGYSAVLAKTSPGSSAALEAKTVLRNIRPYLQNAAVFHSQKGVRQNALLFARAYVDIPLTEAFRGEVFARDDYYPTMVYFAASGSYNAGDYRGAIRYFEEYLAAGIADKRKEVYMYMAKACTNVRDFRKAGQVLQEAVAAYPSDFNLLSMAINTAIDSGDDERLQHYVTRALAMRPDDATLLNIHGKLYEKTGKYQQAVAIYTRLRNARPRSLDVAKHLSLNYFNLGVLYNNRSLTESSPKTAERYRSQAKDYFDAAIPTMKDVLAADPASLKFHEALATAYLSTGRHDELAAANRQIAVLGGNQVTANATPALLAYDHAPAAAFAAAGTGALPAAVQSGAGKSVPASAFSDEEEMPAYSLYAKKYVEERIRSWQAKDAYETVDEYRQRVTEQRREEKIRELLAQAEESYIARYTGNVRFTDIRLRPYDAENEVFLAESAYGELIIPVPRANNEARLFESSWNGMQFKEPKFRISDDRLTLAGLTFVTPTGRSYRYNGTQALDYTETVVDMQFDAIDYAQLAADDSPTVKPRVRKNKVTVGASDVDVNIPLSKTRNEKTFAVVIANENYELVAGVPMALNDGKVFGDYCRRTLGLPESNVRSYRDATYGTMLRAVRDIRSISEAYNGDIRVIFYYAGHGIPDETTKDAFLLPVDADGLQTEVCYPLSKLYAELGGLNARSVCVFLDACFSGAKRDGGMLASARGVALKVRQEAPQGNMVIFSAASGDETAFPYEEKGHGLFTYFLLKKLQQSEGNASLSELSEYVTEQVRRQAVVINRKPQTPVVSAAASLAGSWQQIRLKP